jgi:hypothetical protein
MTLVPAATVLSASSVLLSAAYYAAGLTTTLSVIKAVPEMVETVQGGLEDIVYEVVEGSRFVIHGVAIGIMVIAALAIVKTSYYVFGRIADTATPYCEKRHRRFPSDNWTRTYGGRLKGGAPEEFQRRNARLTVEEATGTRVEPREYSNVDPGQVDPRLLEAGQEISFVYARGRRVGERRTAVYQRHVATGEGIRMFVEERGIFKTEIRNYWIHDTSGVDYAPREETEESRAPEFPALEDASELEREASQVPRGSAACDLTSLSALTATERMRSAQGLTSPVGGVGLDSGSEFSSLCPRRAPIGSAVNNEAPATEGSPQHYSYPFGKGGEYDNDASGNSRIRVNSADAAYVGRAKALGDEWKASRSWKDEQRRRPSGHELAAPTSSPPQRGNARPTLEALRTDGAAKSLFYTRFKMLPAIKQELDKIERTFCGFQYQLDHTECIAQMILKIARYGVEGRLILDKVNFYTSSCARQAARVHELYQAGCQIRISKPSYGSFSCVHVKCFVLDGKVVLKGSMNLTHNGLENNKEHLYRLTEPAFVAEVLADFEKEWLTAEPVTGKEISKMLDADLKRLNKKREQSMSRPSDGNQPGEGP